MGNRLIEQEKTPKQRKQRTRKNSYISEEKRRILFGVFILWSILGSNIPDIPDVKGDFLFFSGSIDQEAEETDKDQLISSNLCEEIFSKIIDKRSDWDTDKPGNQIVGH